MKKLNLKLLYEIFDPITKTSKIKFKYHLIDGQTETVVIPKDKSCKTRDIHAALIHAGSDIPRDFKKCERQLDLLLDDEARELRHNALQLGWQNDYQAFLSPLFKLGDFGGKNLLLPASMQEGASTAYSRIGNRKGWLETVATPMCYSSVGIISLCAAFAAPLLQIIGLQPFMINIHAKPKSSKTTMLLGAMSLYGVSLENQLVNYRVTESSKDELQSQSNNMLFPLNEMSNLGKDGKSLLKQLHDLTYALADGNVKSKNSNSKFAVMGKQASFSLIALSTSEKSILDYSQQAVEANNDGLYARILDFHGTKNKDKTVYDLAPKMMDQDERDIWGQNQSQALREAIKMHHGRALKPYIQYLLDCGVKEIVKKHTRGYEKIKSLIEVQRLDGNQQHSLLNCAALYLGGSLAIEAGLLPIKQEMLLNVIINEFLASMKTHTDKTLSKDEVLIASFKAMLKSLKMKDADEKVPKTKAVDGYYNLEGKARYYRVKSASLSDWFNGSKQDIHILLLALRKQGWLIYDANKKIKSTSYSWATTQKRWLDGCNNHAFEFKIPRSFLRDEPTNDNALLKSASSM